MPQIWKGTNGFGVIVLLGTITRKGTKGRNQQSGGRFHLRPEKPLTLKEIWMQRCKDLPTPPRQPPEIQGDRQRRDRQCRESDSWLSDWQPRLLSVVVITEGWGRWDDGIREHNGDEGGWEIRGPRDDIVFWVSISDKDECVGIQNTLFASALSNTVKYCHHLIMQKGQRSSSLTVIVN